METSENLNYGRHILEKFIANTPVKKVIDLGGGHGGDLSIVRQHHPDAELYAIESNVHYAHHLSSMNIHVHQLNLERSTLPFQNESFDLIIANQIFEHIKDIFWVLHEASRILKTGGIFYIGVPNLAALHNRILLSIGKQPSCIKSASAHVRGFTKPDLIDLLNTAWPNGYQLIQFSGSNFYPLPPMMAKIAASLFPTFAVTNFFIFKKTNNYHKQFIEFPVDLETNFYLGSKIHHEV
jgi:ubiquinone/menaquinone biosynthesis C-methylase UbiE